MPIISTAKNILSTKNIFDEVLSLIRLSMAMSEETMEINNMYSRWGGDMETIYRDVLNLLNDVSKSPQFKLNFKDKTSDNTELSKKSEDPEWFKDLSTNAKTKEEFMFKNCQSRVRGYMSRAEAQICEASLAKCHKTEILHIIDEFKTWLKDNRYHGEYFDRSSDSSARICDSR